MICNNRFDNDGADRQGDWESIGKPAIRPNVWSRVRQNAGEVCNGPARILANAATVFANHVVHSVAARFFSHFSLAFPGEIGIIITIPYR